MKQLIMTFFAVILCYSLFFDQEPKKKSAIDEINYIYEDTLDPTQQFVSLDTLNKYAFYNNPFEIKQMYDCYYVVPRNGKTVLMK